MWISRVLALMLLAATAGALPDECAPLESIEAYEAGQRLIQSGNTEAGIAKLEQTVSIYPDFREAWESLELQYKQTGDFAKAIEAAEQQIRLLPGTSDSQEYAINMYRRLLGTPGPAMKALARSALYEQGSNEAIAACKEAIEIHPTFLEAHTNLVQHYIYADDEIAAKKQLAKVVALDPRGAAAVLVGVIAHLKPSWLTEEYAEELAAVFPMPLPEDDESREAPKEYPNFTPEESAAILSAYEKQIGVIGSLIDGRTDMGAAKTRYNESREIQQQLRSLSFISISAASGGPGNPPWYLHEFFDATQEFMKDNRMDFTPYCWVGKIARDLDEIRPDGFRASAGFGVRWMIAGIIPLVIDYGAVLGRRPGERFGRLHFNIGYTF